MSQPGYHSSGPCYPKKWWKCSTSHSLHTGLVKFPRDLKVPPSTGFIPYLQWEAYNWHIMAVPTLTPEDIHNGNVSRVKDTQTSLLIGRRCALWICGWSFWLGLGNKVQVHVSSDLQFASGSFLGVAECDVRVSNCLLSLISQFLPFSCLWFLPESQSLPIPQTLRRGG